MKIFVKNILLLSVILLFCFFISKNINTNDSASEVNVYSSRKEELIRDLLKGFTESTGIRVNYINDEAAQLITRIENEGINTKADILLTADVVNLILAQKKGLLAPTYSSILENSIPSKYRDIQGYWFGLTKRARVLVYNQDLIKESELSTYEDLANPKWSKKILVRSSNSPYNQSLISFLISNNGLENTKNWIKGLVNNMARKPSGGDTDQIYSVISGEGDIAIVNSYYFARILSSTNNAHHNTGKKLKVFFPNQSTTGTMVNISGGAIVKNSQNKSNAIKLLEYLVTPEAQKIYTQSNQEYPIINSIEPSEILKSWGNFRESDLSFQKLEDNLASAIRLADESGWR